MLMFGSEEALGLSFKGKGYLYNLSSMREGYTRLSTLIPPNELGRFTDRDFDIVYANYIMNNDQVFCEFFQIVYNLYLGYDVFILACNENWSENILESLLKLIQQRYGYNAVRISSDEDYIYAVNNSVSDFAPGYGIYNLDQDKERFVHLMYAFKLMNDGAIPFNLEGFDDKYDE